MEHLIVMIPTLNRYVPTLSENELVKTVTDRDIQFTSFNGKDYPLCLLDEKTPLLFFSSGLSGIQFSLLQPTLKSQCCSERRYTAFLVKYGSKKSLNNLIGY
nr:hypothetical protein [Salmonella enterica]